MSNNESACSSTWPNEQTQPKIEEHFPARARAGELIELKFDVMHGRGESVYPAGLRLNEDDGFIDALEEAGFSLFDPASPHQPILSTASTDTGAKTEVTLPVLALPKTAGRHELNLPGD